jgi:hypothetical protein
MKQKDLVFGVMFLCVVCVPPPLSGETGMTAMPDSASEGMGLSVSEMCFCAAIKDRVPVGVADTFPSDIFSIYCYTRIVGAEDTVAVVHSWYRGDTRFANVSLPVKSPWWRTWSHKKMAPQLHGDWRVDVIAPDSSVIASKQFFLE